MPFRKIQTANQDLMRVQEAAEQAFKPLFLSPIYNGVLLTGLALTTTAKKIDHKLKRQPLGWFLADRTSTDQVYRTAWDANTISLVASANTPTVSIWIF